MKVDKGFQSLSFFLRLRKDEIDCRFLLNITIYTYLFNLFKELFNTLIPLDDCCKNHLISFIIVIVIVSQMVYYNAWKEIQFKTFVENVERIKGKT